MKQEDTKPKEDNKTNEPNEAKSINNNAEPPKNTFVLMKKGDYSIHILIEEIKDCHPIDKKSNKLPYPIIKITCFDKSQRTEAPDIACTDYSFGEHFYFEKTNLSVEQLDSSKIIFEVYDSNNYSKRKDFFGIYEFDLEYIYTQLNHALQNFWFALANPEADDMTEVRGFLKLSISVLHDNDPRVELNMKEGKDSECMIPSQIKMEYRMLNFHIFKAEELPDMDSMITEAKVNRQCDGYVEIKYLGMSKKTSVVKMKNEVILWNEIVDIPVSVPAVSQKVVLLIKDHDDLNNDDLVGSIEIKVSDILSNKHSQLEYFNIYGAPMNKTGGYFDQMNNNAEIGSQWKGRILMKITYQKAETPAAKVRPIEDKELISKAVNLSRKQLWSLYIKMYSAFYLPGSKESYSIRIKIQDTAVDFPQKKAINGNIDWGICKTLQCLSLSTNTIELPDIFIYLNNAKNEPICFQRVKPSSFHLNDRVMIIKLLPDPCYAKVNELCKSGLVKIKIALTNKTIDPPMASLSNFKDGDSDVEEEDLEADFSKGKTGLLGPIHEMYSVVANVYMSRGMMSSDPNGTNDPFVTLTCLDNEQKTSIKYNTINGIWNEKLLFDSVQLNINDKSTWPIFMLKVVDYDRLTQNDVLGYSYLWLSESSYSLNSSNLVKPKWHGLYLPKSNRKQGEVLISFYIFDQQNQTKMYEINSIPETVPYTFEINILGLRELKPLSLLPVKKAYIAFDMNSLNVTGRDEDNLQCIKTLPKDCGENPTINTVIKFDVKLPKDDIFMPELQCQVYDYLLSGMVNPLLGVFLLNVLAYSRQTSKQVDEDIVIMQKQIGMMLTQSLIKNQLTTKYSSGQIEHQTTNTLPKKQTLGKISKPKERSYIVRDAEEEKELIRAKTKEDKDLLTLKTKKTTVQEFDYTPESIEKNKNDHQYFVILPQYKTYKIPGVKPDSPNYKEYQIEDTDKAPPIENYFAIGYIKKPEKIEDESGEMIEKDYTDPDNITKHYRRIYRKEIDTDHNLIITPFHRAVIKRGVDEDQTDDLAIFSALADEQNKIIKTYPPKNQTEDQKEKEQKEKLNKLRQEQAGGKVFRPKIHGKFKGLIRICEKEKMDAYQNMINDYRKHNPTLMQEVKNLNKYENLTRSILVKSKVIVRVYILELNDIAKKDQFSDSDPYIKLYLGNKLKINDQKNHQEDQKNCKWYKHYDLLSELPGDSALKIEVWDYDPLFSDELIGSTSIDLEDRFFCEKWRELKFKPIEVRKLKHPDISSIQGSVYMWLEIFEKKDRIDINPWQISPEPETIVELRLIIWETEEMKCMDVEGTSDVYINAYVNPDKKQSTDVHFRCQTGVASFNWRVIIPISLPNDTKVLTLQAYDNDILAADDFICGATIDLKDVVKIPKDLDVPITFNQEYLNGLCDYERRKFDNITFMSKGDDPTQTKFWVQCMKNNQKEGRILCSLEVLPQWKAEISKVGLGRKEPNIAPYLPPPFGRFTFSLNPFSMLNQCVGPRFRRKIYCGICLVCLLAYIICIVPYLILHVSAELMNPFNYFR